MIHPIHFILLIFSLTSLKSNSKIPKTITYFVHEQNLNQNLVFSKELSWHNNVFQWNYLNASNEIFEKDSYSLKRVQDVVLIQFTYDDIDTTMKLLSFKDTIPYFLAEGLNSEIPFCKGVIYYTGEEKICINNDCIDTYKFEALTGRFPRDLGIYEFKVQLYLSKENLIPVKTEVQKHNFKLNKMDSTYKNLTIVNSLLGIY